MCPLNCHHPHRMNKTKEKLLLPNKDKRLQDFQESSFVTTNHCGNSSEDSFGLYSMCKPAGSQTCRLKITKQSQRNATLPTLIYSRMQHRNKKMCPLNCHHPHRMNKTKKNFCFPNKDKRLQDFQESSLRNDESLRKLQRGLIWALFDV
ncbi:hypothetical protein CEXT_104741 [Caerostris extrusa]|uniref:Uncharacterized protein n=1 Tax=Caerostris extrusa TaxID=172846 RepID=A0AAV4VN89_CAEEX|nr:hypothetical protein CEXT_104741 [Caerostris extrusa]